MPYKRVKGSAILVALLIMALVATIATTMAVQQQAQIERATLVLNNDRMYLYGKAVEAWAIRMLVDDAQQVDTSDKNNINDTAIDALPKVFSGLPVGYGFSVAGKIQDLQGKFNLNNLKDKKYEANFVNLILAVDPQIDPENAQAIAASVHDWVSKPQSKQNSNTTATSTSSTKNENSGNQSTPANSKINRYYTARHPPYRAAQALMASPSELRLVKGVSANLYIRLQPFITALPRPTPINVNTASAPVLASLSSSIDLQTAMQIVQGRGGEPYSSMSDFLSDGSIQNANIKSSDVTMNSTYFLVTAKISNFSEKLTLHAMLYRPLPAGNGSSQTDTSSSQSDDNQSNDKDPVVSVLWESRGGV